jgi:hypothetical protein
MEKARRRPGVELYPGRLRQRSGTGPPPRSPDVKDLGNGSSRPGKALGVAGCAAGREVKAEAEPLLAIVGGHQVGCSGGVGEVLDIKSPVLSGERRGKGNISI